MAEPFYVSGTGGTCTALMQIAPGRIFAKTGAEGVFCAAFPELGYGIALKCDDGATRAAELMMAAVIARLLPLSEAEASALRRFIEPPLVNWTGIRTGSMRPSPELASLGV